MPPGRVIWEGEQRAGWGRWGTACDGSDRAVHVSFPRGLRGQPGGLLRTWPLRGALTCTRSSGLCSPEPQPCCPQPGVLGAWLLSSHASMSVRGPCGRREGGDGLYPWTGLSCKECVALVESQDLRPGCGGHMALGRSTGGSPRLRVGANAAKALSGWSLFSSPRPHLRRRGGQNSSTVVQGPHGWWRPGWLCIQPGPLLTQAAASCCQGDGMLSFLRCLSQIFSARCCRVCLFFSWKTIRELKRAGERSGYVSSLTFQPINRHG